MLKNLIYGLPLRITGLPLFNFIFSFPKFLFWQKKVTLANIAKSLGASTTMVSLIINDKGDKYGISPDTQKKVRAKIKELNYKNKSYNLFIKFINK